ncbi:MAG: winged helix DNA-binding domain-containing protein [Clostridia bacterium]|nr:winged helix DNA-binding domain-containing protein [Clostridia bacterium]
MTLEEIKLRRVVNQYLVIPSDKRTVMRDLMGVQAQFMPNAIHSLKIRCTDFEETTVKEYSVKNWTVRGTVHVFDESDLPLFIRAGDGKDYRRNEWSGRRFWNQRDQWALTPERQRELASVILSALETGAKTRDALKEICRTHGMTEAEEGSMFDPWGGGIRELCERGFMNYVVEEKKSFCLSPAYTPMRDSEAEREMARRYFTHFGPATVHDAMYYFHAAAAKVKEWLSDLPVNTVECSGNVYYYIENGKSYACDMPACLFLAGFDQLMLGYEKKESLYLAPEHLRAIFNLAGIVMPPLMLNGRVVGRWKKKNKKLLIEPFSSLGEEEKRVVKDKAETLWEDLAKIEFTN